MARLIANNFEYIWLALSMAAMFAPWLRMPRLVRRCVAWLCGSTWRAVLAAAMFPIAVRFILLPWVPVPVPLVSDEFGHLLTAETISLGRLANPTPELWEHFETFHTYFEPVYASVYFPGNSICMALSFALFGHPWPGVMLSVALMCGLTVWALERWIPRQWALWGGVAIALRLGITGYWMNSYWGGAMAAIGGILLIGAVGTRRPFSGIAFGLGCAVLLLARPFEGLVAVCVVTLFARLWRKGFQLAPVVAIGVVALGAFGYYNFRLTGSALKPPYLIAAKLYNEANVLPGFVPALPREFRHREMRRMAEEFEGVNSRVFLNWKSALKHTLTKMLDWWKWLVGPLLTIPLLCGMWRERRYDAALVCGLTGYLAHHFVVPHYFAPILGIQWLLVMKGWRWLSMSNQGARLALWIGLGCALGPFLPRDGVDWVRTVGCCPVPGNTLRNAVEQELESQGGRHLVLVSYSADHDIHVDWVYNHADFAASNVLWARAMSQEEDAKLIAAYSDRAVWRINPDEPGSMPRRVR